MHTHTHTHTLTKHTQTDRHTCIYTHRDRQTVTQRENITKYIKQSQFISTEPYSTVGGRGLPGFHKVLSASTESYQLPQSLISFHRVLAASTKERSMTHTSQSLPLLWAKAGNVNVEVLNIWALIVSRKTGCVL